MSKFNTEEFKNLQKYWDEVLKDTGFVDAEVEVNGERQLKQSASNVYRQADQIIIEGKEAYYQLMSEHVDSETYKNDAEQIIMHMIANAYKIKEIQKKLKSHKLSRHRDTIRFIVRFYENKWGVKKWPMNKLKRIRIKPVTL